MFKSIPATNSQWRLLALTYGLFLVYKNVKEYTHQYMHIWLTLWITWRFKIAMLDPRIRPGSRHKLQLQFRLQLMWVWNFHYPGRYLLTAELSKILATLCIPPLTTSYLISPPPSSFKSTYGLFGGLNHFQINSGYKLSMAATGSDLWTIFSI
jgi:hypothetical protein